MTTLKTVIQNIIIADCKVVYRTPKGLAVYYYEALDYYFCVGSRKNGRTHKKRMYRKECLTTGCSSVTYTGASGPIRCYSCAAKARIQKQIKEGTRTILYVELKDLKPIGTTPTGNDVYQLSNGKYYYKGRKTQSKLMPVYKVTCDSCPPGNYRFIVVGGHHLPTVKSITKGLPKITCLGCKTRTDRRDSFASTRFRDKRKRHLLFGNYMAKLTAGLTHQGTAVALGGDEVDIELHRLVEYGEKFNAIRIYDFTDDKDLAADIKSKVEVRNLTSIRRTYTYKHADMFVPDPDMNNDLVFANIDLQRQMTETLIKDVTQYILRHGISNQPLSFILNTVNRSNVKADPKVRSDAGWASLLKNLKDNQYKVALDLGRTTYMGGCSMNLYGATVIPK
jgi:hypothetical protein